MWGAITVPSLVSGCSCVLIAHVPHYLHVTRSGWGQAGVRLGSAQVKTVSGQGQARVRSGVRGVSSRVSKRGGQVRFEVRRGSG